MAGRRQPPILRHKDHAAPSAFRPEGLLREARRQLGLVPGQVPELCVLDPDGDLVRHLRRDGRSRPVAAWACYHSTMDGIELAGRPVGLVGCAVGAAFAVLIAEQMFASGCRLLVSLTSSGQLRPLGPRPYFVLVERAWRDEGTSYHYLPPADFAAADPGLLARAERALAGVAPTIHRGATWTTDAPFRETEAVLAAGREMGLAAIEMECAGLYALARARGVPILCLAHVTNVMAAVDGDFEKGEAGGALDGLEIISAIAARLEEVIGDTPG